VTPPAHDLFRTESANVLVLGSLLLVLFANVYAFVAVHSKLARSRRIADALLLDAADASAAAPLARNERGPSVISAGRDREGNDRVLEHGEHTHADARGSGRLSGASGGGGGSFSRRIGAAYGAAARPLSRLMRSRRVALWPTFAAYVGAFVLSQGPGALCNLFPGKGSVCNGPLTTPIPLTNQVLMYLRTAAGTPTPPPCPQHALTDARSSVATWKTAS
jgi:hypothetical protein